ncbi:MAG: NAD-dependent epimerase/dehydratase family protein [Ignavibacteriales bacterium]|nr:NAD-dependent epimerase/dehydratase family protein [Ignavibacteriales bacterium]MCF8316531.1 NAD-dependent epimerase/dehydratase family protein [Ignavibacteriales bacterium]MCF8437454.1 NAD-dependent epimerase/dehydratase family protein [Ignavibacteriales bacterium]
MIIEKLLVTGATGYLGKYFTAERLSGNYRNTLIVLDKGRKNLRNDKAEISEAELTMSEALEDICVVISN